MTRRVAFSREATKTLLRIDRASARRIRQKIAVLASDPDALPGDVTALEGGTGLMRLRVGDWRAIYTADLIVLLVARAAARGADCD